MRRRNRFLRRLALGLAVVAVAAPVAQARVDSGTGWSGPGQSETFVQGVEATTSGVPADFAQDNRYAYRGIEVPTGGVPADFAQDNRYAYRGIEVPTGSVLADLAQDNKLPYRNALPQDVGREPVQVVINPSIGFDWGDAGIGAGTVFAVLLLGAGAVLATRHVGRPAQV